MKNTTIARGYRLKASTHKLIKKVQLELGVSQEKFIFNALKTYYAKIKTGNNRISN